MLAAYCRGSFWPSKENEDIIKYLHQAGADINITNNDGNSALMLADKKFQEDIVKYSKKQEQSSQSWGTNKSKISRFGFWTSQLNTESIYFLIGSF